MRPFFQLVCLALLAAPAAAQPATQPAARPSTAALAHIVDSLATDLVQSGRVVGLSVAVLRGPDTVVARGYGLADAAARTPAMPSTVYRIGSVTKQFTAAAIMQLVEQGRLSLDDEITKHLPDYPTQGHRVTIRQLLNHTSGIKSYTGLPAWQARMGEAFAPESLIALFASQPFDFAPGERLLYNNSGYFLLGRIIERASGMPYAEYLRTVVYPEAELRATRYCPDEPATPAAARGYAAASPPQPSRPISMTTPYAAGALCSTVLDLVRWQRALAGGSVVRPVSYAAMITPDTLNDGKRLSYGYGLGVDTMAGRRVVAHGGGINGFVSWLGAVPAESLTIAVLVNTEGPTAGRLGSLIMRAALGVPLPPPTRDLPLTAPERARYVGTYALTLPNDTQLPMRVFEQGEQLMAQAQGQGAFRLLAQGDHVFAIVDPAARLTFTVVDDRATRLVLMQGGARMEGSRTP